MERPEDRHAWSRKINLGLLEVEGEVFKAGFVKAFLMPMDSCNYCLDCTGVRMTCKQLRLARPSPDAMAMDVYATVRRIGYPIQVLAEYGEEMNRYAFLLVEALPQHDIPYTKEPEMDFKLLIFSDYI